jgi:hypothetical protein
MINIHFHNIKWAVIPSQGYADSFDSFLFLKKNSFDSFSSLFHDSTQGHCKVIHQNQIRH